MPLASAIPTLPRSLAFLHDAEVQASHKPRLSPSGQVSWFADALHIKGSALKRIWSAVLVITIWATLIAVGENTLNEDWNLTNSVVPLLSVVVGLLLVFRNSTAYNRWDDGRKFTSSLSSTVRSVSRMIWVNVSLTHPRSSGDEKKTLSEEEKDEERAFKKRTIRLLVAFVVAVKHHVRGEFGLDWEDLKSVLPPKFEKVYGTTGYGYGAADADHHEHHHRPRSPGPKSPRLQPRSVANGADLESSPLLGDDGPVILHNYLTRPSLPLPLIISHVIGLHFQEMRNRGWTESLGPAGYNNLITNLNSMTDIFGSMERLVTMGIPTVYGIHLKQCVTLYLLALPFTLVEEMSWSMIPFIALVAHLLLGIEGIASEIEMPFGNDDSDLPLDLVCAELRNEVEHLMARLPERWEDITSLD
ncbi:UPF0187-domain-containing protein [Atractiella rhizophila]|nr:UPF0187-domain-containing protein [Atractiella rhizophila]